MTLYTVRRINKRDKLYGSIHGSDGCHETVCGLQLDRDWYILTNDEDGNITCKKCLEILS